MRIVPTILAETPAEYDLMYDRVAPLSQRLHIDISDTRFAPGKTISIAQVQPSFDHELDLHLMVENPLLHIDTAISLQPHLVIIHAESEHAYDALRKLHDTGIAAGIALLPGSDPGRHRSLIEMVSHVLLFTGNLGYNGGNFNVAALERASGVRDIKQGLELSVDGGVNETIVATCLQAGIDVLYTGGFIQDSADPKAAFALLENHITS